MAANLLVREILSTRRVFLPSSSASVEELSDLALRLEAIGHNRQVSAVLMAPHDDNLPLIATRRMLSSVTQMSDHNDSNDKNQGIFFTGYSMSSEKGTFPEKLQALQKLVRIVHSMSPAPAICVPHGKVCDGGYSICIGRYSLATECSSFQVLNPTRGLSLDGGLSFVLPRLLFGASIPNSVSNKNDLTVAIGNILALTGYEANCYDMVATGLASHFMQWEKTVMLEHELSEMNPFGDRSDFDIVLDEIIDSYSLGSTHKSDLLSQELSDWEIKTSDGKTLHTVPPFRMGEDHGSRLVDLSVEFCEIFNEENVQGIVERLKEVQGDDEVISYAKTFINNIESRSPLAVHATFRLLNESRKLQKLVECLEREEKVQMRLFEANDFKLWKNGSRERKWKHKCLSDVTNDEIEELFK